MSPETIENEDLKILHERFPELPSGTVKETRRKISRRIAEAGKKIKALDSLFDLMNEMTLKICRNRHNKTEAEISKMKDEILEKTAEYDRGYDEIRKEHDEIRAAILGRKFLIYLSEEAHDGE
jgi:hypothetical protein